MNDCDFEWSEIDTKKLQFSAALRLHTSLSAIHNYVSKVLHLYISIYQVFFIQTGKNLLHSNERFNKMLILYTF